MRFPPHFLDQIRARLPVSEVLSKYIRVKRHGREFMALCPFHNEKTPSFTINDEKEFYHCFGCGAHGSIFDFLMEYEKLPFPEAVERLASLAGLPMPVISAEEQAKYEQQKNHYEIMETLADYYHRRLAAPDAQNVREYLKSRRLKKETVQKFRLGYAADDKHDLMKQASAWQVKTDDLVDVGMLARTERGDTVDRFRGRLLFPIEDPRGRPIGFGGRILDSSLKVAKYINSPETPLFHKGRTLYNLHRARQSREDTAIVVEGYMDVIGLDQAGIPNAVAPLGTALTREQMQLLWQYFDRVVACFDGDNAGLRAAARTIETVLPILQAGKELLFIHLPQGEDPDTFVLKTGADAFRKLITGATPLYQKIVDVEYARKPVRSPEARLDFYRRLGALSREITDQALQKLYYEAFKEAARPLFKSEFKPDSKWRKSGPPSAFADGTAARAGVRDTQLNQQALLAALYHHPKLLGEVWETLGAMKFEDPRLSRIQDKWIDQHFTGQPPVWESEEEKLMTDIRLLKLYSALKPSVPVEETRVWWIDTAQALTNHGKSPYDTQPPDVDETNLESWWQDYSHQLGTSGSGS